MATTYTKSLASDFGGNFDMYQFHREIVDEAGITIDLQGVNQNVDAIDIVFVSALSGGEQTILNTLITNHTPMSYKYVNWVLQDKKSIGTNGGSSIANTWVQRDINTIADNDGSDITISNNQFTCQPGKYKIYICCSVGNVNMNKLRLYNTTDSAVTSESLPTLSTVDLSYISLETIVDIQVEKTYKIEHIAVLTKNDIGFGLGSGLGDEIFSKIVITKL